MRRVSYFQSVFDLIDLQPAESAEALAMIQAAEKRCRRKVPAVVRQWYSIKDVVALQHTDQPWNQAERHHLWYDYSNQDGPEPLAGVLAEFERVWRSKKVVSEPKRVRVLVENQGVCSWYLELDGTNDPPVVVDEYFDYSAPEGEEHKEWARVAEHFSKFIFDWFAGYYFEDWTPYSERSWYSEHRTRPAREKRYLNGMWLFAPNAEALAPPHLDFLLEQLTEDARRRLANGVEQYEFRNADGLLRVTSDRYGEPGGASAWWLHADTEEGLFQLAKRVLWCGNLQSKLKHWTKSARSVADRLKALHQA